MSSEMKFFLSVLAILGGGITLFGILVLAITGIGLGFMSLGLGLLSLSATIARYKTGDATYTPYLIICLVAFMVVNFVNMN